jgi:hypothetical protein
MIGIRRATAPDDSVLGRSIIGTFATHGCFTDAPHLYFYGPQYCDAKSYFVTELRAAY